MSLMFFSDEQHARQNNAFFIFSVNTLSDSHWHQRHLLHRAVHSFWSRSHNSFFGVGLRLGLTLSGLGLGLGLTMSRYH